MNVAQHTTLAHVCHRVRARRRSSKNEANKNITQIRETVWTVGRPAGVSEQRAEKKIMRFIWQLLLVLRGWVIVFCTRFVRPFHPRHTHTYAHVHTPNWRYILVFLFFGFFFLWLHTILCAILSSSYAIGLIANRWKGPKNPEIVRHNKKQKDNEIVFRHLYESLKISLCKYEWLLFVRIFSVAFYVAAAAVHSTHTKVHSLDSIRIAEDIAVATSQWVKPNERRLRVKIYTLSFFCSNPWSKHIRYFKWGYIYAAHPWIIPLRNHAF